MSGYSTPGPWHESRSERFPETYIRASGRHVATVHTPSGPNAHIGDANARLIAAAPVMLDALRQAVLALAFAAESSEAMKDDYEAVNAAILLATGNR